ACLQVAASQEKGAGEEENERKKRENRASANNDPLEDMSGYTSVYGRGMCRRGRFCVVMDRETTNSLFKKDAIWMEIPCMP
ncbi:MAG TPA: hypothetical protein VHD63_14715, partial [Ktedonobacteraceae bacterium]|nr:hypothetical protein [Ktedonobacteraceae bacterium]